jgi:hypothetical protein
VSNGVVEIRLDAHQAECFRDILEDQKISGGYVFAFVSNSFEADAGCSVIKFQSKRVSKRAAQRIAKIIKEDSRCLFPAS